MESDELTRSRIFRVVYDDDIEDDCDCDLLERDDTDLSQDEKMA